MRPAEGGHCGPQGQGTLLNNSILRCILSSIKDVIMPSTLFSHESMEWWTTWLDVHAMTVVASWYLYLGDHQLQHSHVLCHNTVNFTCLTPSYVLRLL